MSKKTCVVLCLALGIVLLMQIVTYQTLLEEEAMYIVGTDNESSGWVLGALELLYTRITNLIALSGN